MRIPKRLARCLAILASATALAALTAGPALADPPPGTVPALTSIVGVGSESPLSDQLSTDYNATSPANNLYSWDGVNPSTGNPGDTIVTKGSSSSDTTCKIARPDDSNGGIGWLENSPKDGGDPCIDYAASSRAPASTDPTTIAFVVYAGDAITYSSPEGSGVTSPVPEGMTLADLVNIYNCTYTNWDQVPGNSAHNAPIVPVLPQNGSGTRSTFLLALGGGSTPLTPGSCVVNGNGLTVIEENTGLSTQNVAQFGTTATSTTVDDIYPYSIGDYIAQGPAANGVGGHTTSIWGHGDLVLHSMTDSNGAVQQPTTTNSSSQTIINRSFPSQMQRALYNVVRNGGTATAPAFPTTPAYDATALPAIFGHTGWLCTNSTAQADITSYGFLSLGTRSCGALIAG